jgi:hypothetical protein
MGFFIGVPAIAPPILPANLQFRGIHSNRRFDEMSVC